MNLLKGRRNGNWSGLEEGGAMKEIDASPYSDQQRYRNQTNLT